MNSKLKITVLLVLSLTLFGSFAFADTDVENQEYVLSEVTEDIDLANEQIDNLIENAIEDAELLTTNDLKRYELELDKIIKELIKDVDKVAKEAIKDAAKNDITVYCELIEVEINERVVLIDPLIVGGF